MLAAISTPRAYDGPSLGFDHVYNIMRESLPVQAKSGQLPPQ